jgi:hypothetical protein
MNQDPILRAYIIIFIIAEIISISVTMILTGFLGYVLLFTIFNAFACIIIYKGVSMNLAKQGNVKNKKYMWTKFMLATLVFGILVILYSIFFAPKFFFAGASAIVIFISFQVCRLFSKGSVQKTVKNVYDYNRQKSVHAMYIVFLLIPMLTDLHFETLKLKHTAYSVAIISAYLFLAFLWVQWATIKSNRPTSE